MKQRSGMVLCVILVCAAVFTTTSDAAEPIHIGLSAPLTGQYAGYGEMFKKAIDLAISTINADGGIEGRQLELVVGDSEGNPDLSRRLAQKFTRDPKIVAAIGDFTTTCCMAAQPIYDRAGMVQLSPTASHPAFAPGSPYSFAVFGTQAIEAPFIARAAVNVLGKKRLAVLYINNDWGSVTQKFFVDEAKRLGAELTTVEGYLEGTTDFHAILEKIRATQPEVLFLCLMVQDGIAISQQRQALDWHDVVIMGTAAFYTPELLELGGDAVENLITETTFFPSDPRTEVQTFVNGFQEHYTTTPNVFAAVAYDALNLLAEAIKHGGTDRQAIRDALAGIKDFQGTTGVFTFDDYGNVVREPILLQVRDNAFVIYPQK